MVWYRWRIAIVALWIAVLAAAVPLALHVTHGLSSSGFGDPRSAAAWADAQLGRLPASGGPPRATLVRGVPATRIQALWAGIAAAVRPAPTAVVTALPGHADDVLVDIRPGAGAAAAAAALARRLASLPGAQAQAVTLGNAGNGVLHEALSTLRLAGLVAVPVLAVLLLLVYDSAVAAALPLVVALAGTVLALAGVDLLEPYMRLSVYLTNIVSFLALGVGIDYSLFLSARFRSALRQRAAASGAGDGGVPGAALAEAMRTAGRSVFFSGVAVGASMLALLLPRTSYWSGLAVGGCLAVISVLLTTLTLLPALLALLGRQCDRGRLPRPPALARFWPALASAVTGRPAVVLTAGVLLLALPAAFAPGIAVATPANVATLLAPQDVMRLAVEQLQRENGADSIAPLPVVLQAPDSLRATTTWREVAMLTADLEHLPGVAAVASPGAAGVPPAALAAAFAAPGGPPAALAAATAPPNLVVLSVTARAGPDSAATQALLHRVQGVLHTLPAGWRGAVGGPVALLASFNRLVARTLPWMVAAVAGVALVVLFAASGSLGVAVLAVAFDGLVALATAGVLVFVVQHGHLGFQPLPLDASITPLIFVILFGLSMDYEVILIHRMREHAAAGAGAREAARRGLAETGGMITGAGLLMVVAFASLLLSPLQLMRTMALGMTAAILLDTWIVRTCLVPTSVALLGPSTWWPFGPVAARRPGGGRVRRAA
jgi:uncharacterized membrane protein YdfJ with MMPL/SSD domain